MKRKKSSKETLSHFPSVPLADAHQRAGKHHKIVADILSDLAKLDQFSAVKIILIVVAVIVGLGLLTAGIGAYFVHRAYVKVRDNAHIEEKNGKVKIESPFGNLETVVTLFVPKSKQSIVGPVEASRSTRQTP